jgi:hypothetical protein
MLVFKVIEEEVQEAKDRLAVLGEEVDTAQDEKRLDLLLRIVAYINSFVWLSHGSSRTKLKYFLQNRYDYRQTAEKFGVSVKSLHVSVSYAANRLKKRIGGALEQLQSGDLSAADREFALGTGALNSNLFISAIHDRFAPVKNAGVDLSTCEKELGFLSRFTQHHFGRVLDSLDRQKLEHLLFILSQNDRSYMSERSILYRCLEGEMEPSEAIDQLIDGYLYAAPTVTDDWF